MSKGTFKTNHHAKISVKKWSKFDFAASTIIIIRLIISSLVVVPANHELCCRSKEIDGPRENIGIGF
jgi:hypothetical protein